MPYTRFAVPDFSQHDSSDHSYPIGSFDAVGGRWMRVTITFNARPVYTGIGSNTGTYYSITVIAPDGTSSLISDGRLIGGFAWYSGGGIGAFLPPVDGTYTLRYNTTAANGPHIDLSGCCQYANLTAVVETPSVLQSGVAPVKVMMLRTVTINPGTSTFPVGTFPAVAGQAYKLTCAFDASVQGGGTLAYNLTGSGFGNLPDPLPYDDAAWSKCYVTAIVSADSETCEVGLWGDIKNGAANLYNCFVIAEPFVDSIIP
jgi:hypothetical protein